MKKKDCYENLPMGASPEEALAIAIIRMAAIDYKAAYKTTIGHPGNCAARRTLIECENFFRSSWYQLLTSLDGEYLMKKLREEAEEEANKPSKKKKTREAAIAC